MEQACFLAAALDHIPHNVLRNAFAPNLSCPCYSSKNFPSGYASRRYPEVERRFRPVRDWHGADVATLTDQVYDRPVPLTHLDIPSSNFKPTNSDLRNPQPNRMAN